MNCEDYKIHDGVIIGVQHDLPTVGIICQIFIINGDTVIFTVDHYATLSLTTELTSWMRLHFLQQTFCILIYLYNSQFVFERLMCMIYQVIL